jgi:hypothetical protein
MDAASLISNALWIVLGTGMCLHAWQLRLWDATGPGSGFLPFLAGLILALTGLGLLLRERAAGRPAGPAPSFWTDPTGRNRVALVVGALAALALLMPVLGFLLAAFLVMTFLLGLERRRLVPAVGLAAAASASVYWLFASLLQVRLPRGLLGL